MGFANKSGSAIKSLVQQEINQVKDEIQNVVMDKLDSSTPSVYVHGEVVSNASKFCDQKPTVNGVATFYLTTTGDEKGKGLFNKIISANPVAVLNTNEALNVPICSIKSISSDLKKVEVNVVHGKKIVMVIGGISDSVEFVPDGTTVMIEIVGLSSNKI